MKNLFLLFAFMAFGVAYAQTPVISGLSPTSGYVNTTVQITGSGFTGATAVTFGGKVSGPFTVVSDNLIIARVSTKGASGRVGVIKATSLGGSGTSAPTLTFTVLPPVILRYSPTTCARVGDDVIVIGRGIYGLVRVRIGALEVPRGIIQQLGDTGIKFKIPTGFTSGQICILLDLGQVCTGNLCIIQPCLSVTGVTPTAARPGSYITVMGNGFLNTTQVTIGGTNASFTRRSDNELLVLVPYGVTNGTIAVYQTGCPPSTFPLTLLGFGDNNFRWLHNKALSSTGTQEVISLFTELSGSTVIMGNFTGVLTIPGLPALVSAGASDIFYVRYNNGGVAQSAYRYGGAGDDKITDADMKSSVEMYLAGTTTIGFSMPVAMGSGSVVVGGAGSGEPRAFVLKLRPEGTGYWSNSLTTGDNESLEKLRISYSMGRVFVAAVALDAPFAVPGGVIMAKGNVYTTGLSDATGSQDINSVPIGYVNETTMDADIYADDAAVYLLTHEQFLAGAKQAVFRRLDRTTLAINYDRSGQIVQSFEAKPHVKAKGDTVYVGTSFRAQLPAPFIFLANDPGTSPGAIRSNFIKVNRFNPDLSYGVIATNYALTGMTVDMAARPTLAYAFSGVATIGGRSLTSRGGVDVAYTRYTNNLAASIWTTQAGSTGDDASTLLDVDARNNLYTAINALGSPLQLGVTGTLLSASGSAWYVARFGNTSADGREGVEEEAASSFASASGLKLYPNPASANGKLNLESSLMQDGQAEATLVDASGRMRTFKVAFAQNKATILGLGDASAGLYQLVLRQGANRQATRLVLR